MPCLSGNSYHPLLAGLLALTGAACGGATNEQLLHAGTCAQSFVACGGDPTGTWDITGVCADGDLKSVIGANGTLACEHMTSYADLALSGSLTYLDAWVDRDTTARFSFTTSYTPACVAARDAGVLDTSVCSAIEADLLHRLANGQGGCSYNGADCNCNLRASDTVKARHDFTIQDTWIIEDGSSSYEICVEGNKMTQRQAFLGNLHIQTELRKR